MQVSRLFQILYILLTRERITAPQLAGELEVSVRTIYRDIQALCEAGMPILCEQGARLSAYLPTLRRWQK